MNEEKKKRIEQANRDALESLNKNKSARLIQHQSGRITNVNHVVEGNIYASDNKALRSENECLKKALQEKERIISILEEEIELFKSMASPIAKK